IPSGFTATSGTTTNVITLATTSATATGGLYVSAMNNNGCGNGVSSGLNIQVDQQPSTPNAGPDQPLVCIGNAFLNASAVSSPDAGQWNWLSGTPVPSIGTTTVNSTSISGLTSPNTYKYIWTVTRSGSVCPAKKDTVSITTNWASISCQPAAAFSFGPASDVASNDICFGTITNFTDLSISANQWFWDFNYNGSVPNITSNAQNPSYTYSATGTYTVYLRIYSNLTSQFYNTTQVINVIGAPVAPATIFGTTSGICAGSVSQYVYSISNVTYATSYNWSVPSGANIAAYPSSTSIATKFGNNAVNGNVTVSAANSCGTSALATLSVTINPLPSAAGIINGAAAVCQGQNNVTYSISPIANATGYTWTDLNGNATSGTSTSATYSIGTSATNGIITVQGTNACGVGVSSNLNVTVNPLPNGASTILGSINVNICPGPDTIQYIVSTIANASSYNWVFPGGTNVVGGNSKDTLKVVFPNSAGGNQLISVNGVNACGNGTTANLSVQINTPSTPQICMVTVDSLSMHNIIYWDKTTVTGADSFKIYRENSTNTYTQIGTVSYHSLSEYHDFGFDPNTTTTRYKISAIDSCGNESPQSYYHATIYVATLGGGQFNWNSYLIESSANPVSNYVLMRDSNNTGTFVQIAITSGNSNTLNDVNYANYPNGQWYVDALGFNCTPNLRLAGGGNNSTMAAKIKSHSNQANNRGTGISKINGGNQVSVYPNPTTNVVNISFAKTTNKATIKITSLLGSEVYNSGPLTISGNNITVDISDLANGSYLVQIITDNITEIKKIVKQ
ncbi:MAG: T9SS type A sorting domain-containing protein, partial [Bacteroidia bacterium]